MKSESYLRYLLSDNVSLRKYFHERKGVSLKEVSRSLLIRVRALEYVVPDHYYRLGTEASFLNINGLGELLAGIPSVVYGLIGMLVLVPAVADVFHLSSGACLLAAILVLAVMILPSMISVAVTALNAVPPEYEQASLALGATPVETYFKVSLTAARSGIAAGIVLGIGRAVGEAMAVMMVAGNVANMPGIFTSVTFLTTAIAKEMSYASGLQRQALFSIGLVLFLFIMAINAVLNLVLKGGGDDD